MSSAHIEAPVQFIMARNGREVEISSLQVEKHVQHKALQGLGIRSL